MPRPHKTAQAIDAMRRRILDAAHELLHEGGPDTITVRGIAERVGVSHMALYSYFHNREAILQALRDQHGEQMQARRREQIERALGGACLAVLREELNSIAQFAERHPHAYRLMLLGMPHEHGGHALTHAHLRQGLQIGAAHLAQLIEIGIQQGVLARHDPATSALVVTCMVNGPLLLRAAGRLPDDAPFAQIWEDVTEQAIHYLTACKGTTNST